MKLGGVCCSADLTDYYLGLLLYTWAEAAPHDSVVHTHSHGQIDRALYTSTEEKL